MYKVHRDEGEIDYFHLKPILRVTCNSKLSLLPYIRFQQNPDYKLELERATLQHN